MAAATQAFNENRLADAERALKEAVELSSKYPRGDQRHSTALTNLGALYHRQQRWKDAELYYQRAQILLQSVHGPDHPGLAPLLDNLANLHLAQGNQSLWSAV